jgi:hypothetical protein
LRKKHFPALLGAPSTAVHVPVYVIRCMTATVEFMDPIDWATPTAWRAIDTSVDKSARGLANNIQTPYQTRSGGHCDNIMLQEARCNDNKKYQLQAACPYRHQPVLRSLHSILPSSV